MPTQLQLAPGANWQFLYQGELDSVYVPAGSGQSSLTRPGYVRQPIPEFRIPILPDSHILAVRGDSANAQGNWRTAGWLKQVYNIGGGSVLPNVQNASFWVPLRRAQMIEFPRRSTGYELRFQVPWYLEDCKIKIWEYVGPEVDPTQAILEQLQASMRELLGYPPGA
jgi:hypothetical protein